jgi:hypothetical protein
MLQPVLLLLCRAVPAEMRVRQPHDHTTSVADIEGATPADRDKVGGAAVLLCCCSA